MSEGPVVERVLRLVQPILDDLALELYDCEFAGGTLRITADKRAGEGNVTLDELALLTRLVNRELDHEEGAVPGNYSVEVTSPGLERQLRRPAHFVRAVGSTVSVRLHDTAGDERRLHGTLVAADDEGIVVRLDDDTLTERRVAYDQIERARTVFVWGPAPKPGKKPAAGKRPRAKENAS